jgi:hypothetical protein
MKIAYYAPLLLPVGLPSFSVDPAAREDRKSARKARKERVNDVRKGK